MIIIYADNLILGKLCLIVESRTERLNININTIGLLSIKTGFDFLPLKKTVVSEKARVVKKLINNAAASFL